MVVLVLFLAVATAGEVVTRSTRFSSAAFGGMGSKSAVSTTKKKEGIRDTVCLPNSRVDMFRLRELQQATRELRKDKKQNHRAEGNCSGCTTLCLN